MAWLDSGWKYRKSITLSRSSGAVTNYQMKLLIGESSGASGEDIDCHGKCLSSFNDLRFTKSDGITLLDYWVESISGTTPNQLATVWIEFDSIDTSDTTFYMYYGNSGASAASNGINTFIKFDNFEWGSNNDNLSLSGGGVTWTASSGIAKISTSKCYSGTRSAIFTENSTTPEYTTSLSQSDDISIRYRLYKETNCNNAPNVSWGNGSKFINTTFLNTEELLYYNGSSISTGSFITPDTWQLLEFNNFNWSSGTYNILINGSIAKSGATMASGEDFVNVFSIRNVGTNTSNDIWIDDFIIRNYRSTEPAWGTWGAEQTRTKIYLPFRGTSRFLNYTI